MFVCMKVVERISLRYFSGKYRVRRVPQVRFWNLGLGVDVSLRGDCDADGAEAPLRQR
jgi:hypothetical protein